MPTGVGAPSPLLVEGRHWLRLIHQDDRAGSDHCKVEPSRQGDFRVPRSGYLVDHEVDLIPLSERQIFGVHEYGLIVGQPGALERGILVEDAAVTNDEFLIARLSQRHSSRPVQGRRENPDRARLRAIFGGFEHVFR